MARLLGARTLLASFQTRSFRFLWASDALASWAEQMEFVVLSWFVLVETGSPFLVGVFGALRFSGTLLAPLYGIAVDRYSRRKLLAGVRTGFAAMATAVLFLSLSGGLGVWQVLLLVGLNGAGRAFDTVTRQAVLADIAQGGRLTNAVALTRTARDVTQMIGPVVGGVLLSRAGLTWAYVPIVVMYLVSSLAAHRLQPSARVPTGVTLSLRGNLVAVAGYIRRQQVLLALLALAFLMNFAAFPLNFGLIPVFARDVLGTDEVGLAVLLGALATGAFLGSGVIAALRHIRRPGRLLVLAMSGWFVFLLLFSQAPWFGLALVVLLMAGLAQSVTSVTMTTLLLRTTSAELRGRVMGVRSMAVYGLPMGILLSGAVADALGAPTALAINAGVGIALTLLIAVGLRRLWRLA